MSLSEATGYLALDARDRARAARGVRSMTNTRVLSTMGSVLFFEAPSAAEREFIRGTFMQELMSADPGAREAAVLAMWGAGLHDDPEFGAQFVKAVGDPDEQVSYYARLKLAQWSQYRQDFYRKHGRRAPLVTHVSPAPSRSRLRRARV